MLCRLSPPAGFCKEKREKFGRYLDLSCSFVPKRVMCSRLSGLGVGARGNITEHPLGPGACRWCWPSLGPPRCHPQRQSHCEVKWANSSTPRCWAALRDTDPCHGHLQGTVKFCRRYKDAKQQTQSPRQGFPPNPKQYIPKHHISSPTWRPRPSRPTRRQEERLLRFQRAHAGHHEEDGPEPAAPQSHGR